MKINIQDSCENSHHSRIARMWNIDISIANICLLGCYAVRPVCLKDVQALATISHRAFLNSADEASEDIFLNKISAIFNGSYGSFIDRASFVHETSSGTVDAGVLVTNYTPYGAPVIALAVVEKIMQRQGIGKTLILNSLSTLQKLGETACCARITYGNVGSERLFQSCGFARLSK